MAAEVRVEDHSAEVIAAKDAAVERFLTAAGLQLEGQAAKALEMSPRRVDTGLLRNSVTFGLGGGAAEKGEYSADEGGKSGSYSGTLPADSKGERTLYIGTNVEYAVYVHEGTRRMTANPFIKNAVEANKDQLEQKLREALGG